MLNDLSTNPEIVLTENSLLYRCRVLSQGSKINAEEGFYGYGSKDSFVAPAEKTKDMRANYKYIPYLYCSNDPYVAMVEVRPRLSARVSIATIKVESDLTLLDLMISKVPHSMKGPKKNLLCDLSYAFSKPVEYDDETMDYIPTQYIAEYVKYLQYDGIVYRSSLIPEINRENVMAVDSYNVVIFNYEKCRPIRSNVFQITGQHMESHQIDNDENRLNVEIPILRMSF